MKNKLIGSILQGIVPNLFGVIDKAVADKDLAVNLKHQIQMELMNSESEFVEATSSIIRAEATGESWLQRNWRPGLMVWFSVLIGAYWFGYTPENLSVDVVEKLFTLVQIGVGGYVVGRSGEKIAKTVTPILKGNQ